MTMLGLQQLLARGERPFPACPQVTRYFPASGVEGARQALSRAIDRGEGPALVIGTAGTGKTLLLQVLAARYHATFDVVLLGCARLCTRRALLQSILFELGLPYRMRDEGELRLSLLDQLLAEDSGSQGLLLLVDEGQCLSPALLDELRVLTNVVRGGAARVRLVVAGSASLEETFSHPELESFSQRLATRAYLGSFSRVETAGYIRAQVAASGGDSDGIFAADALDAIFDATDGLPRLVNQLCDRALLIAEREKVDRVDAALVQAAWADLQQLPIGWSAVVAPRVEAETNSPSSIEFGSLGAESSAPAAIDDYLPVEMESERRVEPEPAEEPVAERAKAKTTPRRRLRPGSDPFAEEFEEEEIVFDHFSAWDEVVESRTRVENRRDVDFAGRVREAMVVLESAEQRASEPTSADSIGSARNPLAAAPPAHEETIEAVEEIDELDEAEPDEGDLQPIRLAIVADPPRLTPIPLFTPPEGISTTGAAAFDPVLPEFGEDSEGDAEETLAWPVRDDRRTELRPGAGWLGSADERTGGALCATVDEDPILIIEKDGDAPESLAPTSRRAKYRNLFSRLRSG